MIWSRQTFLGIGMIVGGSIMLYAMAQQIDTADKPAAAVVTKPAASNKAPEPLTTDLATEKRLLAQKQKERAARIAEQEKRAKELLAQQESAEAEALAKSRAENQRYADKTSAAKNNSEASKSETSKSNVEGDSATNAAIAKAEANPQEATSKPESAKKNDEVKKAEADKAKKEAQAKKQAEQKQAADKKAQAKKAQAKKETEKKEAEKKEAKAATAAPKSVSTYRIESGDSLGKLAEKYHVPLSALTQANGISKDVTLKVGQKLTIPSQSQIAKLKQDAQAAKKAEKDKRQQEEAKAKKTKAIEDKLENARKQVKETDAKGSFGVQVALATSQANADEVVKKLKAAGYDVKTSKTDRGVRVMVGPERGKVAALALKDKINNDPNVKTDSAWVLYWR